MSKNLDHKLFKREKQICLQRSCIAPSNNKCQAWSSECNNLINWEKRPGMIWSAEKNRIHLEFAVEIDNQSRLWPLTSFTKCRMALFVGLGTKLRQEEIKSIPAHTPSSTSVSPLLGARSCLKISLNYLRIRKSEMEYVNWKRSWKTAHARLGWVPSFLLRCAYQKCLQKYIYFIHLIFNWVHLNDFSTSQLSQLNYQFKRWIYEDVFWNFGKCLCKGRTVYKPM